jgi:hypothetical protein
MDAVELRHHLIDVGRVHLRHCLLSGSRTGRCHLELRTTVLFETSCGNQESSQYRCPETATTLIPIHVLDFLFSCLADGSHLRKQRLGLPLLEFHTALAGPWARNTSSSINFLDTSCQYGDCITIIAVLRQSSELPRCRQVHQPGQRFEHPQGWPSIQERETR